MTGTSSLFLLNLLLNAKSLLISNFYFLLKCLHLGFIMAGFIQLLDTLLKLNNFMFEIFNIAVVSIIFVMSVSAPFKFTVFEHVKPSTALWVAFFTLLVLTKGMSRTYITKVFIHTLLPTYKNHFDSIGTQSFWSSGRKVLHSEL